MFLRCKRITSHYKSSGRTRPVNLENRAWHICSDHCIGSEELEDGTEIQSHMLDLVVEHCFDSFHE